VPANCKYCKRRTGFPCWSSPESCRRERLRILAVDDELPVLRYLQHALDEAGYQCLVTSDPSQVTKFVELEQPDLILMDVRMPEMDGLEASRRITAAAPPGARPRIVAMTANAMQGDREMCMEAGMDDYVTKPIRVDALVEALNQVTARKDR